MTSAAIKTPTFRGSLSVTIVTQVLVAVGGLMLYRLLAVEKGASGVASYALVKQIVVFASPPVMLGMATAIPRYVALSGARGHAGEQYLLAGIGFAVVATAVVGGAVVLSPDTTAALLLGDPDRANLILPLVAMLAASVAYELTAGYLRGGFRFKVWGVLTAFGVAGVPVALVIVLPDASIGALIALMALVLLGSSAAVAIVAIARALGSLSVRDTLAAARTLLSFGSRRVPGELAAIGLFALPPVVAAHVESLDRVAYLTVGLYVVAVVSIAFQPLGFVLLPLLSRLWVTDQSAARQQVAYLCAFASHVALFMTPQLVLFSDVVVRVWLGSEFDDAGPVIRITMLPLVLFVLHLALRTSLDAVSVKAYNSRNSLIALGVFAGAAAILLSTSLDSLIAVAWAFAAGVFVLGALTLATASRLFAVRGADFYLRAALPLAAVAAGVGYAVREAVVGSEASVASLLAIVALETLLASAYVAALIRAGVTWPRELRMRLSRRPGAP